MFGFPSHLLTDHAANKEKEAIEKESPRRELRSSSKACLLCLALGAEKQRLVCPDPYPKSVSRS